MHFSTAQVPQPDPVQLSFFSEETREITSNLAKMTVFIIAEALSALLFISMTVGWLFF